MSNITMSLRESVSRIRRNPYLIIVQYPMYASLFLGLALTCLADKVREWWWFIPSLISHFGEALIIASIIGFFIEITEFKEFFEKRLINILFSDEYMESMKEESLIRLCRSAIIGIGKAKVNNQEYEYEHFLGKILDEIVLENIGNIYRKNFTETIHYRTLETQEIQELVGDHEKLKGVNLVCITTTTRFRLIAPREDDQQIFNLDKCCNYSLIPIIGLSKEKQLSFRMLSINGVANEKINLEYIDENEGSVTAVIRKEITFGPETSYTADVEYTTQSYQHELPGRLKRSMNTLTRGATIQFSSPKELLLDAEFFGLTGYSKPCITPNSISVEYNDWALPEDGYFISWQERDCKS